MSGTGSEERVVMAEIRTDEREIEVAHLIDLVAGPECGAVVSFQGCVRGSEGGRPILGLRYEHHPVMAGRELHRVLSRAVARFDLARVACIHRVGMVASGETVVAIAVSAPHRDAAFEGCRYIIDELKKSIPVWKDPVFSSGLPNHGETS
jgi:molybdopterin synthase catalytic subunit